MDRDRTLKTTETLLRQGRVNDAIRELVRLIEAQPEDWSSVNTLGDLYVRAGQFDQAVAQFGRAAEHFSGEGFYSKAAALYKKALKIDNGHEPTLLRLSEIAARQDLYVDARRYLQQLMTLREHRGDPQGAAECVRRLGALEDARTAAEEAARRAKEAAAAPPAPGPEAPPAPGPEDERVPSVLTMLEADLRETLAQLGPRPSAPVILPAAAPLPVAPPRDPGASPPDLESVFDEMRSRAARGQLVEAGTAEYESGLADLQQGRITDAVAHLRAAARSPVVRFRAASALGRLYVSSGDRHAALEWFEHAAAAPPPTREEHWTLLYELADVLEGVDPARALAILLGLEADAGAFRDVPDRIAALTRRESGSRGA